MHQAIEERVESVKERRLRFADKFDRKVLGVNKSSELATVLEGESCALTPS